jgi:Fe-S-cluster-containing dehydrogenase component/DMSO reductase anchor subunit
MRQGFIFNQNRCVGCNACCAACNLENGWEIHPRTIYKYNDVAISSLLLYNISLACNHCETAICLYGCPTSAFTREPNSGAVIIDEEKCIGCKYCKWNCPYDSPKYNEIQKTIGKCNLCHSLLREGYLPACTTACPTGALGFGVISDAASDNIPYWFPDKNLNPAIEFISTNNIHPLKIIPEKIIDSEVRKIKIKKRGISGEWSLILFSFFSTLSVATIITSIISGIFPNKILFFSIIILAGLLSFFHLGKKLRAWRAIVNLRNSPLSREILMYILYLVISSSAVVFEKFDFLFVAALVGLIFLFVIDSVYIFTDKRLKVILHSGQTFLSMLFIVSFFTGNILSFLFIALLKLSVSVYNLSTGRILDLNIRIRFFRIALLLIAGASVILDNSYYDKVIIVLFLTGELFDRIIFYLDFDPLNINKFISNNNN